MTADRERGLEHVIWISRHQWSLMQRGELPLRLDKDLYNGRRLVVDVAASAHGRPQVQSAWIERRTFLARMQRSPVLPEGTVVVRLTDG